MSFRCYLLVIAALTGVAAPHCALGQAMLPPPTAVTSAQSDQVDPLPGLPRPADAPASLLQAPPPVPAYSCAPLPGPYFERDPRLDPPCMPEPGWSTEAEGGITKAHVKNKLMDTVTVGARPPDTVHLPSAELDWAVMPGLEVGYRLPSGFGAFSLGYRFLSTEGTGTFPGPDAPAALRSRLAINVANLDYTSREFYTFQWPCVEMKWWFGLRFADVFFDSTAIEPFAAAAAGSGIFETHVSNTFWGIGPHVGLELTRRLNDSGLILVSSVDGATLLGRIRQHFSEESTAFVTGSTGRAVSQDVPIIHAFAGLSWQPPRSRHFRVDCGYEYEYWWNVGRNSDTSSRGELSDQGVLLRAGWNW
jgi:Legionella pneumophila major outer membrane protein precursor